MTSFPNASHTQNTHETHAHAHGTVACAGEEEGFGGSSGIRSSGHPRIFLTLGANGVTCPYCGKHYPATVKKR